MCQEVENPITLIQVVTIKVSFSTSENQMGKSLRRDDFCSLRKHPFLLALRSWGRWSLSRRRSSARNVPSGEERGETDVFAGCDLCDRLGGQTVLLIG